MQRFDLFNDRIEFRLGMAIDQVGQVLANHWHIGRDHHHIQFIDFVQFFRFC